MNIKTNLQRERERERERERVKEKLKKFLNKRIAISWVSLLILLILLSGFFAFVRAWTNPSQNPPNGSGAVSVNSSGNVGIGTTNPLAKLEVSGNLSLTGTTGTSTIATNHGFAIDASRFVVQQGSGNVGINTANPSARLHIREDSYTTRIEPWTGTTAAIMIFRNTGGDLYVGRAGSTNDSVFSGALAYAGIIGNSGAYPMQLGANGSIKMTIASGGNVGIATSSPQAKLDVDGTLRAGGITDTRKAYGQAYRSTSQAVAASNTWYDLDLNGGSANKKNITHDTGSNPDRITVTYAGIYRIKYTIHFTGANSVGVSRLRINDTTEIPGSYANGLILTTGIEPLEREVITSLAASDFVSLQYGANNTGTTINYNDDANIPDPTTFITAIVTIEKIE